MLSNAILVIAKGSKLWKWQTVSQINLCKVCDHLLTFVANCMCKYTPHYMKYDLNKYVCVLDVQKIENLRFRKTNKRISIAH